MKIAILLALLLAGCEPSYQKVADHMVQAEPATAASVAAANAAAEIPPPGLTCETQMVMGMAEITCR